MMVVVMIMMMVLVVVDTGASRRRMLLTNTIVDRMVSWSTMFWWTRTEMIDVDGGRCLVKTREHWVQPYGEFDGSDGGWKWQQVALMMAAESSRPLNLTAWRLAQWRPSKTSEALSPSTDNGALRNLCHVHQTHLRRVANRTGFCRIKPQTKEKGPMDLPPSINHPVTSLF